MGDQRKEGQKAIPTLCTDVIRLLRSGTWDARNRIKYGRICVPAYKKGKGGGDYSYPLILVMEGAKNN